MDSMAKDTQMHQSYVMCVSLDRLIHLSKHVLNDARFYIPVLLSEVLMNGMISIRY